MVDLYFYRDPEAEENKEIGDESKVPGAEEVGPPVESAYPAEGGWDVQGPGAAVPSSTFATTGAVGATTSWEADGGDWAASSVAPAGGESWADTQPVTETKW